MAILNLKNFAKIVDSDFNINDITVFAGKPGTGKSFIMKFLYAETEAMSSIAQGSYTMHYVSADNNKSLPFLIQLENNTLFKDKINNFNEVNSYIKNDNYIKAYELITKKTKPSKYNSSIAKLIEQILQDLAEKQKRSLSDSNEQKFHFIFRNILESIFGDINQINESFLYSSDNLKVSFSDNNLSIERLKLLNDANNSLFVETPLILEFEKFLPHERFNTPYHIDSLMQELNKNDFTFKSEEANNFINDFAKSTSTIINGNIAKGAKGFTFESHNGKTYNIINASSGIKSIGLLQYLVKNIVIKKGSTLFWEEPEVHLHPTWQLKMVELFIELMNAGVKIVFSTHSPFMADQLNAITQRKELTQRVSFNLLSEENGVVSNTILTEDTWGLLQDELLGSLQDIMWQYL